jgi:hypothetical protein
VNPVSMLSTEDGNRPGNSVRRRRRIDGAVDKRINACRQVVSDRMCAGHHS